MECVGFQFVVSNWHVLDVLVEVVNEVRHQNDAVLHFCFVVELPSVKRLVSKLSIGDAEGEVERLFGISDADILKEVEGCRTQCGFHAEDVVWCLGFADIAFCLGNSRTEQSRHIVASSNVRHFEELLVAVESFVEASHCADGSVAVEDGELVGVEQEPALLSGRIGNVEGLAGHSRARSGHRWR